MWTIVAPGFAKGKTSKMLSAGIAIVWELGFVMPNGRECRKISRGRHSIARLKLGCARARSVFERALGVEFHNTGLWFKYIEMETKNKFLNSVSALCLSSNKVSGSESLRSCHATFTTHRYVLD